MAQISVRKSSEILYQSVTTDKDSGQFTQFHVNNGQLKGVVQEFVTFVIKSQILANFSKF